MNQEGIKIPGREDLKLYLLSPREIAINMGSGICTCHKGDYSASHFWQGQTSDVVFRMKNISVDSRATGLKGIKPFRSGSD